MKIQISVCGHARPISLATGWVSWELGMSDFLICLCFVFPLCPCEHTLFQSCKGDGLWPSWRSTMKFAYISTYVALVGHLHPEEYWSNTVETLAGILPKIMYWRTMYLSTIQSWRNCRQLSMWRTTSMWENIATTTSVYYHGNDCCSMCECGWMSNEKILRCIAPYLA